ncbi:MAG: hypothetical protein HY296_02865 [Thaumarchaeota archaeon]|nr:hypothetical protein [Nitrososphaerota archaeon]
MSIRRRVFMLRLGIFLIFIAIIGTFPIPWQLGPLVILLTASMIVGLVSILYYVSPFVWKNRSFSEFSISGEPDYARVCQSCRYVNDGHHAFCAKCGKELSKWDMPNDPYDSQRSAV